MLTPKPQGETLVMFKLACLALILFVSAATGPAALLALLAGLGFVVHKLPGEFRRLKEHYPTWVRSLQVLGLLTVFSFSCLGAGYVRSAISADEGAANDKVAFAPYGDGYESYSWFFGGLLGRQYARRDVRDVVSAAFAERAKDDRVHVLAEVGLRTAGDGSKKEESSMWGHFSHKSGVAVDIHLPILDGDEPTTLPSNLLTAWGYLWRFDAKGDSSALAVDLRGQGCKHKPKLGLAVPADLGYSVDFDELARLLAAIHDEAKQSKTTRLKRVILWPPFRKTLKKNEVYKELFAKGTGRRIRFTSSCAWFLHDEHIHLDFSG